MLHHTTNPANIALDIAEHESEEVWKETGDGGKAIETLKTTFDTVLMEQQPTSGVLAIQE